MDNSFSSYTVTCFPLSVWRYSRQNKITKQLINYAELAEFSHHKTKNYETELTDRVSYLFLGYQLIIGIAKLYRS